MANSIDFHPDSIKIKCPTPFFVTFIGRSGSTHLQSLLNTHPNIYCECEIFNPRSFRSPKNKTISNLTKYGFKRVLGRNKVIQYKLKKIYQKKKPTCRGFEFKINKDYNHTPEVYNWLKQNNDKIKCLFLYRKNNLRGAISFQNYKRIKKIYKSANITSHKKKLDPINLDLDRLIKSIKERELLNTKYYEELSKYFNLHSLTYESLVYKELSTLNEIFEFLEIEKFWENPTHKTHQISKSDIFDYVANYNDLFKRLKKEGLDYYLELENLK